MKTAAAKRCPYLGDQWYNLPYSQNLLQMCRCRVATRFATPEAIDVKTAHCAAEAAGALEVLPQLTIICETQQLPNHLPLWRLCTVEPQQTPIISACHNKAPDVATPKPCDDLCTDIHLSRGAVRAWSLNIKQPDGFRRSAAAEPKRAPAERQHGRRLRRAPEYEP